jgi:hypothetical protein
MKNAIIVPGRPDEAEYNNPKLPTNSTAHWYPWLAKQLQINNIFTVAIDPPKPYAPRYDVWKREFERFDITPETTLIGHSCGGGFLIRWLSENKSKTVGKVVLVAPWVNPENNPNSDTADFFDFKIDPDLVTRTAGVTIFNSDNDQRTIHESVKIIRDAVKNVNYREFHHYGHFCVSDEDSALDMPTVEFTELVEEILR